LLRGGSPPVGVLGLDRRHASGVSDYHDLEPLAAQAGARFLGFHKVSDPAVRSFVEELSADWLLVIGLSQLVPGQLRTLAKRGAIGFHPTPLPEGRGRAPVAWTILLNRPAAANLFLLTDDADAGDIIDQRPVPVLPDDYAADLTARTNTVLEQMVADLSPALASGAVPRRPQDHRLATYYPRRRPEDGRIDWTQPLDAVYRLIRATSHPYPGAFTLHNSHKLIIWRALPLEESSSARPGTVVRMEGGLPVLQTGSGLLQITDMEWEGGTGPVLAAGVELGG
jgi:methionyl-tRNA formyltransferase